VNICDHGLLRVQEKPIPYDRIDEVFVGEGQITQQQLKLHTVLRHPQVVLSSLLPSL
jgi:hypothetical protein